MNQNADDVGFGDAIAAYGAGTVSTMANGLEWKSIGVLAILFCVCACGLSCSKFMQNVAGDPT